MTALRTLMAGMSALFSRRRGEEGLAAEIAEHLKLLADEYQRLGLPADEARAAARKEFGGVDQIKECVRDQRGFLWFEMLRRDIRYAVRSLSRAPAFTLAAISTLALGIGATTALFSVVNEALLRPLPYPRSQDLWSVRAQFTDGRVTTGLVSPVELKRLKEATSPNVTVALSARVNLTLLPPEGTPQAVAASAVDEGFFPLFGLSPILGSGFKAEYFRKNGPNGAVISTRLWHNAFGGDPKIVGKTLSLATGGVPILGVAAPEMDVPRGTEVWINLQLNPQDTGHGLDGYLRMPPGMPPAVLRSRLGVVAQGLGLAFVIEPFVKAMVGDLRPVLMIVFSATALLFILACVNVANLLLARASLRSREVAVRAAAGASRTRIVRQLLTESAVLATMGTVAGLAVGYGAVRALLRYGASQLPRLEVVPFDTPVLLFAIGMLVLCAVGVGLAPVLQLAGSGIEERLRERARTAGGTRSTYRALRMMLAAEVAVAVTIVAGTGLLVRSFLNLQRKDPGFASGGRLTLTCCCLFTNTGSGRAAGLAGCAVHKAAPDPRRDCGRRVFGLSPAAGWLRIRGHDAVSIGWLAGRARTCRSLSARGITGIFRGYGDPDQARPRVYRLRPAVHSAGGSGQREFCSNVSGGPRPALRQNFPRPWPYGPRHEPRDCRCSS